MEQLEEKLDEDFLFYLGFTNTFLRRLTDPEMIHRCRVWIYRLCADPSIAGVDQKRCRNIYLAQLLICMQNGNLEQAFLKPPLEVDLRNAMEIFGAIPKDIEQPEWLNDTAYDVQDEARGMEERRGRTYLATRTLPDGRGAFAYIGVSLTDEEPAWQAGAGDSSLDRKLEDKFKVEVPPSYEMEKILAKRKDPKERERVLTFYDVLMQNLADEIDGKTIERNDTIEGLLEQLTEDLKTKGEFAYYEGFNERQRRYELLLTLYHRVKSRRDKVAKREEILDNIEQTIMPESFFEASLEPADMYELPAAMWEQAINKMPGKKHMERLLDAYPVPVIEKFVEYLADRKEEIAERMHRRHENTVMEMRKELRKEGEKKRKLAEDAEVACHNAETIYNAVLAQYKKVTEAEAQNKKVLDVAETDHSQLYEKMKAAVFDTQKLVEQEAARGKFLATQINAVSEQSEVFNQVNDDIIRNTEEANMKIMRNIKRLNAAVKQCEVRISEVRNMATTTRMMGKRGGGVMFIE